jgi:hypothetical protein
VKLFKTRGAAERELRVSLETYLTVGEDGGSRRLLTRSEIAEMVVRSRDSAIELDGSCAFWIEECGVYG